MALISINYVFTVGAVIIAAQHNSNFSTIYSDYNGNIQNVNIDANAAIAYSKLSLNAAILNTDLNSGVGTAANNIVAHDSNGDIEDSPWADYSGTSTIVGWTSSSGNIYTKKVGKIVFVYFTLSGTSNSTSTTFTVPYVIASVNQFFLFIAQDNTGSLTVARGNAASGGQVVTLYEDVAGSSWTASGTKSTYGQLWYQSV